jgi:hypothetical protein
MSTLLDTIQQTPAQVAAQQVLRIPKRVFDQNLRQWLQGVTLVWNNPRAKAADVLAALGTSGAELFQRSAALQAFLEAEKPGCTNVPGGIKPVTVNADGSVTMK